MPIDLDDQSITDFEGRRAEARQDYESRLITARELKDTLDQIDADEDEYFRRTGRTGPETGPATDGPATGR